jgi:hypothetical protein
MQDALLPQPYILAPEACVSLPSSGPSSRFALHGRTYVEDELSSFSMSTTSSTSQNVAREDMSLFLSPLLGDSPSHVKLGASRIST